MADPTPPLSSIPSPFKTPEGMTSRPVDPALYADIVGTTPGGVAAYDVAARAAGAPTLAQEQELYGPAMAEANKQEALRNLNEPVLGVPGLLGVPAAAGARLVQGTLGVGGILPAAAQAGARAAGFKTLESALADWNAMNEAISEAPTFTSAVGAAGALGTLGSFILPSTSLVKGMGVAGKAATAFPTALNVAGEAVERGVSKWAAGAANKAAAGLGAAAANGFISKEAADFGARMAGSAVSGIFRGATEGAMLGAADELVHDWVADEPITASALIGATLYSAAIGAAIGGAVPTVLGTGRVGGSYAATRLGKAAESMATRAEATSATLSRAQPYVRDPNLAAILGEEKTMTGQEVLKEYSPYRFDTETQARRRAATFDMAASQQEAGEQTFRAGEEMFAAMREADKNVSQAKRANGFADRVDPDRYVGTAQVSSDALNALEKKLNAAMADAGVEHGPLKSIRDFVAQSAAKARELVTDAMPTLPDALTSQLDAIEPAESRVWSMTGRDTERLRRAVAESARSEVAGLGPVVSRDMVKYQKFLTQAQDAYEKEVASVSAKFEAQAGKATSPRVVTRDDVAEVVGDLLQAKSQIGSEMSWLLARRPEQFSRNTIAELDGSIGTIVNAIKNPELVGEEAAAFITRMDKAYTKRINAQKRVVQLLGESIQDSASGQPVQRLSRAKMYDLVKNLDTPKAAEATAQLYNFMQLMEENAQAQRELAGEMTPEIQRVLDASGNAKSAMKAAAKVADMRGQLDQFKQAYAENAAARIVSAGPTLLLSALGWGMGAYQGAVAGAIAGGAIRNASRLAFAPYGAIKGATKWQERAAGARDLIANNWFKDFVKAATGAKVTRQAGLTLGTQMKATDFVSRKHAERVDELARGIVKLSKNPQQAVASTHQVLGPTRQADPKTADRVQQQTVDIAARAADAVLPNGVKEMVERGRAFADEVMRVNDMKLTPSQRVEFMGKFTALTDPVGTVMSWAHTPPSRGSIDIIKQFYPEMYKAVQEQIVYQAKHWMRQPGKKNRLTYQQRAKLSLMFGIPADDALVPETLAALQSTYTNEPGSGISEGEPNRPREMRRKLDTGAEVATDTQSVEEGR